MSDLLNKVITIKGCETKEMKNGKFMSKIKDQDGKNYTIFHTKKDGTESKAYDALKKLPMSGLGKVVKITYKEEPFEKDGQQYVGRTAVGLEESTVIVKQEELITGENVTSDDELAKFSFKD